MSCLTHQVYNTVSKDIRLSRISKETALFGRTIYRQKPTNTVKNRQTLSITDKKQTKTDKKQTK